MKKWYVLLSLSFLLCMLSIHQIRMRMILLYLIVMIIALIKKRRNIALMSGIFCVGILVSHYYLFNNYLNKLRFPVFKTFYEIQAKTILKEEKEINNEITPYKIDKRNSCIFLTQDCSYHVYRDDKNISVYFPADVSFFHSRGYVYCEDALDETSYSNIDELLAIKNYDYLDIIDGHWVYIQVY